MEGWDSHCIRNSAARIVTNTALQLLLKNCTGIPIERRLAFKTTTLVYKFLHSGLPQYFDPLLPVVVTMPDAVKIL